eukprot:scaffold18198_cov51-Phaeocystis_antarctica.AAC.1
MRRTQGGGGRDGPMGQRRQAAGGGAALTTPTLTLSPTPTPTLTAPNPNPDLPDPNPDLSPDQAAGGGLLRARAGMPYMPWLGSG